MNIREYSNSFELFKFLPIRVRALYGMVLIYGNEGFTLLVHARPKVIITAVLVKKKVPYWGLGKLCQKLEKIGCGMIGMERCLKMYASTGNRTRAARVAGEHSTTEPSMLVFSIGNLYKVYKCYILHQTILVHFFLCAAPTVEMRFSSQSLLFQPLELPLH